jgi:hypothetical protein
MSRRPRRRCVVHGLNAAIFDARIPLAKHVEREADDDDQVKKLVETRGWFSALASWNICGTRISNASVVLRAQKEQLSLDEKKTELQSKSKQEKRAKLLLTARKALDKHESSPVTMTADKDWIDIRYWVLPESKAPGLMKEDVRNKMQSSQNSYLLRAIGNRTYRV